MDSERVIIGRDKERRQLEMAIGPGDDGQRLIWFGGPSGRGKTTLAEDAIGHAPERGFEIAIARGRAGALTTPYAPWLKALPEFATVFNTLASEGADDPDAVGTALVEFLEARARKRAQLVVVDDAQALDESSIALLAYVAGMNEDLDISLLFVEQTDAVGVPSSYRAFLDGLVARRIVQHIELQPMSDDAIAELVRYELDLDAEAEVPEDIIERAQGNPWFAKELAHSWRRGADAELPTTIAAAASSRLHSLDDESQDLVLATALCPEGAHIGWLEALADEQPRRFARRMEGILASGLVREDDEIVAIAHPLMQEALLDELSAAMKRALHLELVEAIESTSMNEVSATRATGFHFAEAGRTDEAVERFTAAAHDNVRLGKPHEAAADYSMALRFQNSPDERPALLRAAALLHDQIGSSTALDYWTELGRHASAAGDRETYAYALVQQYASSADGRLLDRLERAASLGEDSVGWAARARALLWGLQSDWTQSAESNRTAVELARASGDRTLELEGLQKLGICESYMGRFAEAVDALRAARDMAIEDSLHTSALEAWHALIEVLLDDLRTSDAVAEAVAALRYADDLGVAALRPHILSMMALAFSVSGQLSSAIEHVQVALADVRSRPSTPYAAAVAGIAASVALDAGDIAATEDALELFDRLSMTEGYGAADVVVDGIRARLACVAGNPSEGVARFRALAWEDPLSMGLDELAIWFARYGLLTGHADAVDAVRERRKDLSAGDGLSRLRLEELDLILGGSDAAAFDAVQEAWERSGRQLDALRARLGATVVALSEDASESAIDGLKSARAELGRIGASFEMDVVGSRLRSLGRRSRAKSRESDVGPLTKRELQIAQLVAQGLRNAEVAETLFLAEKTVAAHLSNIYGKVGVRSRVQLTAWLQDQGAADASVAS